MKNLPLNLKYSDSSRNKTGRQILLVEPNYRNKYPPLGLMKLSAYHKQLGDTVIFFKGQYSDYLFNEKLESCLYKIKLQHFELKKLSQLENLVRDYLKYRHQTTLQEVLELVPSGYFHTVKHILLYYATRYSPERKWDRIYVTTLFTFYWKQTIVAIEFAKKIVKSIDGLYIGGVAASLIHEEFAEETGLVVGKNIIVGLLDKQGILDDNDIIIDEITPDYSILETVDYHYPLDTGYLTYMTKGCTRKCQFCAVPKLEPVYKQKISIKKQIKKIAEQHGEHKDLILMDNNVLGSPRFPEIIKEILDMGFTKDAQFVEPNRFLILTNYFLNNDNSYNEYKYLEKLFYFLEDFGYQRIKNDKIREQYYQLLSERELDALATFSKEALLDSKDKINEFIEKYRNKARKLRYVDFNQGLDCRYIDEKKMKLLSKIPIRPMRISFDYLSVKKQFEKAVRLANKYDIRELSNYMLYNYKDKPEELWKRLKICSDLNKELEASIYSFPMKYLPAWGADSRNRSFVGRHWCPKYLRAIQIILNVTKGVVAVTPSFVEKAFGKNVDEYFKILRMPEPYIRYRYHFEETGDTKKWEEQWQNLTSTDLEKAKSRIYEEQFTVSDSDSKALVEFMKHYQFNYKPSN
ncbi:hypothetical protein [Candidatus Parabeggiatoa sp. HSG14]|uniref:radical SAM protein n=1 Tax=Candidatus Parabeggiatoa sp. HSG14 TaxID=3055593 RepID=UPI0025A8C50B|nr:radical SAM protein [Thiotrichales bacterium HSG14]